jgi:hypothetical protein
MGRGVGRARSNLTLRDGFNYYGRSAHYVPCWGRITHSGRFETGTFGGG